MTCLEWLKTMLAESSTATITWYCRLLGSTRRSQNLSFLKSLAMYSITRRMHSRLPVRNPPLPQACLRCRMNKNILIIINCMIKTVEMCCVHLKSPSRFVVSTTQSTTTTTTTTTTTPSSASTTYLTGSGFSMFSCVRWCNSFFFYYGNSPVMLKLHLADLSKTCLRHARYGQICVCTCHQWTCLRQI